MAVDRKDRQDIFCVYRPLFTGSHAEVRQLKTIKKILNTCQSISPSLIDRLGIVIVSSVLKDLLEKEIFSSEVKAKLEFPELYEISPDQVKSSKASCIDAAKEKAEVAQEIQALDAEATESGDTSSDEGELSTAIENVGDYKSKNQDTSVTSPTLFPVQLPYALQYLILTNTQKLLEECCYQFARRSMPNLLFENHWDCAEAIELTKWTAAIRQKHKTSLDKILEGPNDEIYQRMLAVAKVRHAAVHRVRVSAKGIIQLLTAAIDFAETLSDSTLVAQLKSLQQELRKSLRCQVEYKHHLEAQLRDQLEAINTQREELLQREQEAISLTILNDDIKMHEMESQLKGKLSGILHGSKAIFQENRDRHCDRGILLDKADTRREAAKKSPDAVGRSVLAPSLACDNLRTSVDSLVTANDSYIDDLSKATAFDQDGIHRQGTERVRIDTLTGSSLRPATYFTQTARDIFKEKNHAAAYLRQIPDKQAIARRSSGGKIDGIIRTMSPNVNVWCENVGKSVPHHEKIQCNSV